MIKKKFFSLILSPLFLLSCSQIKPQENNEAKIFYNEISKLSKWNEIILFYDTYYTHHEEFPHTKKSIAQSEFSKTLQLKKIIALLNIHKDLNHLFLEAIKIKVSTLKNIRDYIAYSNRLSDSGIEIEEQVKILTTPFTIKQKLLLTTDKLSSIENVFFVNIIERSKLIRTKEHFFKLIKLLSTKSFNLNQIYIIASSSPFYKNHIQKNHLRLCEEFKRVTLGKKKFEAPEILGNFIEAYQVENLSLSENSIKSIKGAYAFFKALDLKVKPKLLLQSFYAKRIKIKKVDLSTKYRKYVLSGFDKEIAPLEVKAPCYMGSCWIRPSTSKFELDIQTHLRRKILISYDYLYKQLILSQILKGPILNNESITFNKLVNSFGLVPKSSWKPKKRFSNKKAVRLFQDELIKLESDLELKKISNTYFNKQVVNISDEIFGETPDYFKFKGEFYTSQSFRKKLKPILLGKSVYVGIKNKSANQNKYFKRATKAEIDQIIIKNLDRDNAIPIIIKNQNLASNNSAFLIIGYELDRYERISRLKLQLFKDINNSHLEVLPMEMKKIYNNLAAIIVSEKLVN